MPSLGTFNVSVLGSENMEGHELKDLFLDVFNTTVNNEALKQLVISYWENNQKSGDLVTSKYTYLFSHNSCYLSFGNYPEVFTLQARINGSPFYYSTSGGTESFVIKPLRASYTYDPSPTGGFEGETSPFVAPEPLNPKDVSDIPFYQNLFDNGEIDNFDDLSQEEYDYLQSEVQKKEMGWFDSIINKTKDMFIGASSDDIFRDVNISYDENVPELVAYYGDNGLDPSKSYNINLDGIRVGYENDGSYVPLVSGENIDKSGIYTVSKSAKDKFLTQGGLYIGHTASVNTGLFSPSTPTVVSNVGTGAVIGLLTSGVLDTTAQKSIDLLETGIKYVASKGASIYDGWTNSGNRIKDLFNHKVQSEAYTKGINTVTQGEGNKVLETTGTVTIDSTNLKIDPVTLAPDVSLPVTLPQGMSIPVTLADGVVIPLGLSPDVNLPLGLPTDVKLPLSVPPEGLPLDTSGKTVDISSTSTVKLEVLDTSKVKLDTEDSLLKLDGLGDVWKELLALLVTQFTHKNSMSLDEKKKMANILEKHQLEYKTDGAIRVEEGNMAKWKVKEFETTVNEGLSKVNKIDRDILAWQGMHSLNPDTSYTGESDTAGNQLNIPKGLIGALLGSGIVEFLREGAMSKALLNIKAQAQADQIEKKSNDTDNNDDNDEDIKNIVKGLKKVVYPSDSDYVSQGEGFGSGLKDLQVHSSKMEVK